MDRVSLGLCSECGNVGMWKFGGWGLGEGLYLGPKSIRVVSIDCINV